MAVKEVIEIINKLVSDVNELDTNNEEIDLRLDNLEFDTNTNNGVSQLVRNNNFGILPLSIIPSNIPSDYISDSGQTNKFITEAGLLQITSNTININIIDDEIGIISTEISNLQNDTTSNNGVLQIVRTDGSGKVPSGVLPNSIMEFKGTFNPVTSSPALIDGVGNAGDVYIVIATGSYDFGGGNIISLNEGDFILYNGSIWQLSSGYSYTKSQSDALFLLKAGDTMSGNLNMGNNNILTGTGNINTNMINLLQLTGGIELGIDVVGKEIFAGSIFYNRLGTGCVEIVGAGSTVGTRNVFIYDNLLVSNSISCLSINTQNSNITMGSGDLTCDTIGSGAITCSTINTQNNNITMGTGDLTCDTIGSGAITCTTINTTNSNIQTGTGNINSNMINLSQLTGGIELGIDIIGKEAFAGSIFYDRLGTGCVEIVGAGLTGNPRRVIIYDNLIVSNSITCLSINTQNANITMGTGDLTCDTIGSGAITCTTINTQHNDVNMGNGDLLCNNADVGSINGKVQYETSRRFQINFTGDGTTGSHTTTISSGFFIKSFVLLESTMMGGDPNHFAYVDPNLYGFTYHLTTGVCTFGSLGTFVFINLRNYVAIVISGQ